MGNGFLNFLIGGYPHMRAMDEIDRVKSKAQMENRRLRKTRNTNSQKIDTTREELGALTLGLLTLVKVLVEKGVLSKSELNSAMEEVDALDGATDGKVNIGEIYHFFGEERPNQERASREIRFPKPRDF